jgi:catechol 2,3-dioxygenase-like lactoylglutathione lyase family enzyme
VTGTRLGLVTVLVEDYDEALAYYAGVLGFDTVEDRPVSPGKRWLVVRPPGGTGGADVLLARAATDGQRAQVGAQAGGRVAFFLETDDFDAEHARLLRAGVRFTEAPRREAYGSVAVFEDLYGNRWDLLGPPGSGTLRA